MKKIGMIALFLVTGSQEQVMKMFGESPAPVSNEAKAQTYNPTNYFIFSYCTIPAGGYWCYPCFPGPRVGGQCVTQGGNCLTYSSCG
ncbi:hypothetical protein [Thermoflexibacter ruber]|uniref:hypothetical protein n=1 Tax=Thermoflexibacter ruber TaxID=1003 RepID=UPI001C86E197|nr:hypothetical protein [Thermoflexibacter ruber]